MQAQTYLLAANVLVWLGVGGYLFFIARKQQRIGERLRQTEQLHD